jgi:hypothetical protein
MYISIQMIEFSIEKRLFYNKVKRLTQQKESAFLLSFLLLRLPSAPKSECKIKQKSKKPS